MVHGSEDMADILSPFLNVGLKDIQGMANQIYGSWAKDMVDILSTFYWCVKGYTWYSQSDPQFMSQGYARYTFVFLHIDYKDIRGRANQIYTTWPEDIVDTL